jgi:RNA polymerase I-specific transcription initiation factor RRN6
MLTMKEVEAETRRTDSPLLAVGRAMNMASSSGKNTVQVLAMASGEAGHLLRLLKPQVEDCTWGDNSSVSLRVLNLAVSENGYWHADGGAIEQVVFATDDEGANTSWLGVRKLESTTIFRPVYLDDLMPSKVTSVLARQYPPSRLSPNPILTLKIDRTGGRYHADMAFNPWYVQQFAVIDEKGYWSIWDVEGQKRKQKRLAPGKVGHIYDDQDASAAAPDPTNYDGWGRILWAGDVSTIVICNRRHLAVFDLKSRPTRLQTPELVGAGSPGWILDVKRSPAQLDHLYVLTSSRLFLLQISSAGEGKRALRGAQILLSCPHFRDADDNNIRFELLQEGEACLAFLYSTRSFLVNTYRFASTLIRESPVLWSYDAFYIKRDSEESAESAIASLCIIPASLMPTAVGAISGPGKEYLEKRNEFYQLLSLGSSLEVSQTLVATTKLSNASADCKRTKYQTIVPPTKAIPAKTSRVLSGRLADDFIVPDGLEDSDDETGDFISAKVNVEDLNESKPGAYTIDATTLYEIVFGEKDITIEEPELQLSMSDYIQTIIGGIHHRKELGKQGLSTCLEFCDYANLADDIDDAAVLLGDFMESINEDDDEKSLMNVSLRSTGIFDIANTESMASLSDVYDKMVDLWVSCLPRKTPPLVRLAKERLVRNTAAELFLSSLLVSVRDKAVITPAPASPVLQRGHNVTLAVRSGKPDYDSSTGLTSSQPSIDTGFAPILSLPTPSITLPSESTSITVEPAEDDAIARLRGYAISIKSQKPLGATRTAILAHWPSTPGVDPSTYSWEATQSYTPREAEIYSDDEEAVQQKKDDERRRRRTERFLKRQRTSTVGAYSQPVVATTVAGSQPEFDPRMMVASSQMPEVGLPMTQPDTGRHGSRMSLGKAVKKRRTKGF